MQELCPRSRPQEVVIRTEDGREGERLPQGMERGQGDGRAAKRSPEGYREWERAAEAVEESSCFSDNMRTYGFAGFLHNLQSLSDHAVVGEVEFRQIKHAFRQSGIQTSNRYGKALLERLPLQLPLLRHSPSFEDRTWDGHAALRDQRRCTRCATVSTMCGSRCPHACWKSEKDAMGMKSVHNNEGVNQD